MITEYTTLDNFESVINIFNDVLKNIPIVTKKRGKKRIKYYNVPCAFDIETTSINYYGTKCGIMYIWQFGINDKIIIGRTWEEFHRLISYVESKLDLSTNIRLPIYVHNLAFEFQFIMKHFNWIEVLALNKRSPRRALTDTGLEFRCSYKLSGYSLEKLADNLTKYKAQKMVGDLDYSLVRLPITPLTERELDYCIQDVVVLMNYIKECMERDGDVGEILQTKTSYVRSMCRKHIFQSTGMDQYRSLMSSLIIKDSKEYTLLKQAFAGGFTHANAMYAFKTIPDTLKIDITSSYPTQMFIQKYPMSSGQKIDVKSLSKDKFEYYLKNYCCLFEITFIRLSSIMAYENYISESHCRNIDKGSFVKNNESYEYKYNNGRIVNCRRLTTTITDVDYWIIQQAYEWEESIVTEMIIYQKQYLPTPFVECIIKLYKDKTELKGIPDKETEYMLSKNNINSLFGMSVTDIARSNIIFTDNKQWDKLPPDIDNVLEKYAKEKNRFLFYPWGVWITAYARRAVWYGIIECGNDYVYCDTDSLVIYNYKDHLDFIKNYNDLIKRMLYKACDYHRMDYNDVQPKTIKGERKLLGIWDIEDYYVNFKTNGAKRYMYETYKPQCSKKEKKEIECFLSSTGFKDNSCSKHESCPYSRDLHLTVSGVNKKKAIPFLQDNFDNPFEAFDNGLTIPKDYSGKNVLTYNDEEIEGVIEDYLGNVGSFHELSSIHLDSSDYTFNSLDGYIEYILGYENID